MASEREIWELMAAARKREGANTPPTNGGTV
jgi:hypothetical protein